jgi:hypothetical protein
MNITYKEMNLRQRLSKAVLDNDKELAMYLRRELKIIPVEQGKSPIQKIFDTGL